MPRLDNTAVANTGGFTFAGAGVDVATVATQTNRAIVPVMLCDSSQSIGWAGPNGEDASDDVRGIVTKSVAEMRAKGVHEGAYIGAADFNTNYGSNGYLKVVIPFTGIDDVDESTIPILVPGGTTPMYGAAYNALNDANNFGKMLDDEGVTVDLFFVLVTDGKPEGQDSHGPGDVKQLLAEMRDEKQEVRVASVYFAVIGVGDKANRSAQQRFADEIGADAYFFAGDLSGGTIGKIVGWFSSSVHLSQQVGTGSQAVDFETD